MHSPAESYRIHYRKAERIQLLVVVVIEFLFCTLSMFVSGLFSSRVRLKNYVFFIARSKFDNVNFIKVSSYVGFHLEPFMEGKTLTCVSPLGEVYEF